MQHGRFKTITILALVFVLALASLAFLSNRASAAPETVVGHVYLMTNATAGNSVMVYNRMANGTLRAAGQYYTGGTGTGAGLGSQSALILNRSGKRLLAVNAGSNSISVFKVNGSRLQLLDTVDSGGVTPVSLTLHNKTLFVLNAGNNGNIAGFTLDQGHLTSNGSSQPLSGAGIAPAQISFNPAGTILTVTEKNTNLIDTFVVDANGQAGAANVQPSNGQTPFGFAYAKRGHLIVSEAYGGTASSVSSYTVAANGNLTTVTNALVAPNQKAACWIAITPDGRFAYTTNAATGTLTGFAIAKSGALSLLDADGVTGTTGGTPIDMALSRDGQYMYVLNNGLHTIDAFAIQANGSLVKLPSTPGLPAGTAGIIAK
jgi:6-phosphogluconolactonase